MRATEECCSGRSMYFESRLCKKVDGEVTPSYIKGLSRGLDTTRSARQTTWIEMCFGSIWWSLNSLEIILCCADLWYDQDLTRSHRICKMCAMDTLAVGAGSLEREEHVLHVSADHMERTPGPEAAAS